MGKPVSGNKLADILGVSRTAVRKAINDGRINRLSSGLIDPDAARAAWAAATDPARSKVRTSRKVRTQGAQEGAQAAADIRTEADAREAVSLVARILAEEGARDDGKGIDFGKARTAELILKARQRALDQEVQAGTLVSRAAAENLFFETGREIRDAWLAWPARVAIPMAERLKVDFRLLTAVLAEFVKEHLMEMGEPSDPEWKAPR